MKIINIESFNDFEKNLEENNINFAIINIGASWCKPCNKIKEELNQFIDDLDIEDSIFLKIDYDLIEDDDDFLKYFEIKKILYFIIFKNKSKIKEFQTGDIEIIKTEISSNINNLKTDNFNISLDF